MPAFRISYKYIYLYLERFEVAKHYLLLLRLFLCTICTICTIRRLLCYEKKEIPNLCAADISPDFLELYISPYSKRFCTSTNYKQWLDSGIKYVVPHKR